MNNATDRKTINTDNYQFYFNKLLKSRGIKNQNDVLTKEIIKVDCLKTVSYLGGILGKCHMIFIYIYIS